MRNIYFFSPFVSDPSGYLPPCLASARFSLNMMATACFWLVTFGPPLLPECSLPCFHLCITCELGIVNPPVIRSFSDKVCTFRQRLAYGLDDSHPCTHPSDQHAFRRFSCQRLRF